MELHAYEQVLLIGLHDEKGSDTTSTSTLDKGVAGAALIDLLRAGALAEDGKELVVAGDSPSDAFLTTVLGEMREEEKPRKPKWWVDRLPRKLKPFREKAAARLVDAGVLGEEHKKTLGLFAHTVFPERDGSVEAALRSALLDVLVTGREPTTEEAELIALLVGLELVPRVVDKPDRREAKKRAKQVAESSAVSTAVKRAVQDVHSATMVAATAGAGVAGS